MIEVQCNYCHKTFFITARRIKAGRGRYCDVECRKNGHRKKFDETKFALNAYQYFQIGKNIGDYSDIKIKMGARQRLFVNRDKFDHFFFQHGVHNEVTAYYLGILITDGSVGIQSSGSQFVRLEMTDSDIVESFGKVLSTRVGLSYISKRRTCSLRLNSAYLFHDLCSLGCFPNKTQTANYPDIPIELDRHFIRGVIDGDGSWVGKNKLLLKLCGNNLLLYGVYLRIRLHLAISPQSVEYPHTYDTRQKMYSFCSVRYNITDSKIIRDWLYQGAIYFGKRKFAKAYSSKAPYTDLFTTPKLANHLGVEVSFIKRNIQHCDMPYRRVGPYYYFTEEDIKIWEQFLKSRLSSSSSRFPNKESLVMKWLQ